MVRTGLAVNGRQRRSGAIWQVVCFQTGMHRRAGILFLISVCSLLVGCNKLWPTTTAADVQAARHAMPISEVSLMVRSHYDQNKIIAEIQRRHVPMTIDGNMEAALVRFGAKPALIATLKNNANVLTRMQKQAFDDLAAQHDSRVATLRSVPAEANDQPNEQSHAVAVVNTGHTDTPEEAYWKADAAYRAKKKQLESQIASEQGSINWKRAHGYHQSELASAEDRLHEHEDELKNLKTPMR